MYKARLHSFPVRSSPKWVLDTVTAVSKCVCVCVNITARFWESLCYCVLCTSTGHHVGQIGAHAPSYMFYDAFGIYPQCSSRKKQEVMIAVILTLWWIYVCVCVLVQGRSGSLKACRLNKHCFVSWGNPICQAVIWLRGQALLEYSLP